MPPGNSAIIPPNTWSPLTAVSASNGVGSGLTRPRLALTVTVSCSNTSIVYVAEDSPLPELPSVPLVSVPLTVLPLA